MNDKDLKNKNKVLMNEIAKNKGFEKTSDLLNNIDEGLNSTNEVERMGAERLAQQTVTDLMNLVLRQEVIFNKNGSIYDELVAKVYDGEMTEGNTKQYITRLKTGVGTYDPNKFVPDKLTKQNVEQYKIQIYADDQYQLSPQGYQFKKEQTFIKNQWLPKLKEKTLNNFISQIKNELDEDLKFFKFDKLAKIISKDTDGKIVNSTATNMFDAILELTPLIDEMTLLNADYNQTQGSKNIYAADRNDLMIFCSTKTRSRLINGIKTQLFNAKMLGDESGTFSYETLKVLGRKLTIPNNQDDLLEVQTSQYIDDNTIIVVDMSRIKDIIQVRSAAVQEFKKNLSIYYTYDVWGAMDILPWCKKLVFKCPNLNLMPE